MWGGGKNMQIFVRWMNSEQLQKDEECFLIPPLKSEHYGG